MPRPALTLDPARTALLLSECQNGVIGSSSALPKLAAATAPVIPAIASLAAGFRAAGGLVVHLTFVPVLGTRSANRAPAIFDTVLSRMADWTPDHPGTRVVDEIGVGPDDLVLSRHSGISPTFGNETFAILRNAGITTVVVAGVSLNIAIPVILAQAADEGFTCVVPRDAVAGTPAEHAESVLRYTVAFIARVSDVAEILHAMT